MKKTIIFDFNGTMIYDTPLHARAWDVFMPPLIGRRLTQEELDRYVIGQPNDMIFRRFLGDDLTSTQIAGLAYDKEAEYRRQCLADPAAFHLVDGVIDFLDYLKAERYTMTIATGSPKENLEFYLEQFDLARWFAPDAIIYDDGSYPGKPAPDIYLLTMARLEVSPTDCVVFEDSLSGVEAAHNADIETVYALRPDEDAHFYSGVGGVTAVMRDFTGFRDLTL